MKPVLVLLLIVGGSLFLVFMAALVIPRAHGDGDHVECMNNLRQIGGLLASRQAGEGLKEYSGPAFLLQVADDLQDEDLGLFICPGEPKGAAPDRPPVGSPEFIRMYWDLTPADLAKDRDWSRYTSYAGPNWRQFPREKDADRLWACDHCAGGAAHHDGITVLWNSSKVDFLKPDELTGMSAGLIQVGPDSPDPRLEKMIFNRK